MTSVDSSANRYGLHSLIKTEWNEIYKRNERKRKKVKEINGGRVKWNFSCMPFGSSSRRSKYTICCNQAHYSSERNKYSIKLLWGEDRRDRIDRDIFSINKSVRTGPNWTLADRCIYVQYGFVQWLDRVEPLVVFAGTELEKLFNRSWKHFR